MSKLRSQLNQLTSDQDHSGSTAPAGYNETVPPAGDIQHQDNHQKLTDIQSAIENLTGKLNAAKSASNRDLEPTENTPQSTQNNLSQVDPQMLAQNVAHAVSDDLRRELSIEIDKMRQELGSLQVSANGSGDQAVLNDIQQISQGIHDLQAYQEKNAERLGEMNGGLRGIQEDVRAFTESQTVGADHQNITETIQLAYNEIANKLDSLGTSPSENHINALSEKLETIKNSIASTDPETLIRIENQLHALGERIAALANNRLEGGDGTLDALLPEYFESFDRRLDEITRAVMASASVDDNASNNDAFERIEARISSLAKSFDNISAESQLNADHPPLPEQLQETLARLEEHIIHVKNTPSGELTHSDGDFGDQLASLAQKIDHLHSDAGNSSDQTAISSDFSQKLDTLSLTLERAINSGDGSVEQLERQISQLSERIEEAVNSDQSQQEHHEQNSSQITAQLQAISERVDSMDPARENNDTHSEQLSALEGQMSAISAQLNSINGNADMSAIEQRLGGIEEQFANNREHTIEAATQAVQQAGNTNNNEDQAHLISSLAEDLKQLSQSSFELKGHSLETFDAVRDSLSMILDRINSIEDRMASNEKTPDFSYSPQSAENELHNADMVVAAREYASSLTKHSHDDVVPEQQNSTSVEEAVAGNQFDETAEAPLVDAPSLDMQNLPEVEIPVEQSQPVAEADIPLEPGSGTPPMAQNGPNMDALFKQAKENKRKQTLEDEQQNPTDFIAAARKAAQAAANEANSVADSDDNGSDSSNPSFKNPPARRKKLMMLSAAAIILALLAVPAFNYMKSSVNRYVTQSKPPASEQKLTLQKENTSKNAESEKVSNDQEAPEIVIPAVQKTVSTNADNNVDADRVSPSVVRQFEPTELKAKNVSDSEIAKVMPEAITNETADNQTEQKITKKSDDVSPVVKVEKAPMPPQEVGPIALRQAAANGNPNALFEIGRRYTKGIDGPPNFAEAIKWYRLAAKTDLAPAQYRLGNFNEKGHGVKRDVNKAATWYELAARQGNALAMHNLAVVHAMGVLDGGVNMEEATLWFEKAAEFGVKDSQVNLGVIYATAMGVTADLSKAYKWFAIAAKAGDKDAAQKRDTIAKRLKADQLKATRGEVELWRPQELNKKVNSVQVPAEWELAPQITASLTSKQMIAKAQSMLAKLGYTPGTADGLMGAKTIKAIKAFQTQAGLEVNGEVSQELLTALEKSS